MPNPPQVPPHPLEPSFAHLGLMTGLVFTIDWAGFGVVLVVFSGIRE